MYELYIGVTDSSRGWFTPQTPAASQDMGTQSRSPTGVAGTQTHGPSPLPEYSFVESWNTEWSQDLKPGLGSVLITAHLYEFSIIQTP